jgi:NADPH-dependent dioxygenase
MMPNEFSSANGAARRPSAPQVLIAGAGPVGLTLAHELARRGVAVRLVDAAPRPPVTSRALATHARTLETYDQMGLLGELLPRGQRVDNFTLHQNGRRLIRFCTDYSHLPTRFPFTLMVDQVITEEVLRQAVRRLGVVPEQGVRVEDFTRGDGEVSVRLRHGDHSTETLSVPWLVGCDGGHSTVRKQLGLPLAGESSETWLIADAIVHTDLPRRSIHWLRTGNGTVMLVPFPDPGKWRLLDTADASYRGDPDEVASRFAAKISAGLGQPTVVETPTWVSIFTIQQRMISQMRVGRCLVAGDAAHVHSPASGQGMNTGIQDAYNLGWKLAMVVQGHADSGLLDSYTAERVPVGEALLASTRVATRLIELKNSAQAAMLPVAFGILRNLPPLKSRIERKIMGGMSALGLTYRESPLTAAGPDGHGPQAGDRLSRVDEAGSHTPGWAQVLRDLRDPRWTLLVFPGQAGDGSLVEAARALAGAHEAWLLVRTVTDGTEPQDSAPSPLPDPDGRLRGDLGAGAAGGWLLVRPDGYVAARGHELDASALAVVPRASAVLAEVVS